MAHCQKCGAELEEMDLYEDYGMKVCEDCKIRGTSSPSQPCGGERFYTA